MKDDEVEMQVKREFQNKFKLLYGYDSEKSDDEDQDGSNKQEAKRKDRKFTQMMLEFEKL